MARARLHLLWPDTHYSIHDPLAIEVGKKALSILKPDEVNFGGDILDAAAFGSHPKSQVSQGERYDYIEHEIDPANALIDFAARYARKITYLEGNHEYRVERHCANTRGAEEYFRAVDPKQLLGKGRSKSSWKWVPYLDVAGSQYNTYQISPELELSTTLLQTHGWSVAKRAAAEHMAVGRGVSVAYNHTHRSEMLVDRDPWTDKNIASFCPGCMSQLSKPYTKSKPTGWTHGFSLVYVGRRSWTAYNVAILKNECVLPGGATVRV